MDKLARRTFKLGSGLFVWIFVGHTIAQLVTDFGSPEPAQAAVFAAMGSTLGMGGSQRSMLDFARGNSYGMGIMYAAVGLLLLTVARTFDARSEPYPRPFSALGFVAALAGLLVALRFHPLPPVIFLSLASASFAVAYVRSPLRA